MKGINWGEERFWMAFKCEPDETLMSRIALLFNIKKQCSWEEGLANDETYFITPRVNDWYFITTLLLDEPEVLARDLSKVFGEVHLYGFFRSSDFVLWSIFENGQLERYFKKSDGEINRMDGIPTVIELELTAKYNKRISPKFKHLPDWDPVYNKERFEVLGEFEHLLMIATSWDVSPDTLNEYEVDNFGYILTEL